MTSMTEDMLDMMISMGMMIPQDKVNAIRASIRAQAGGGVADTHPGMKLYTSSDTTHSLKAASVNGEVDAHFVVKALENPKQGFAYVEECVLEASCESRYDNVRRIWEAVADYGKVDISPSFAMYLCKGCDLYATSDELFYKEVILSPLLPRDKKLETLDQVLSDGYSRDPEKTKDLVDKYKNMFPSEETVLVE
jgi:hypothetical protein